MPLGVSGETAGQSLWRCDALPSRAKSSADEGAGEVGRQADGSGSGKKARVAGQKFRHGGKEKVQRLLQNEAALYGNDCVRGPAEEADCRRGLCAVHLQPRAMAVAEVQGGGDNGGCPGCGDSPDPREGVRKDASLGLELRFGGEMLPLASAAVAEEGAGRGNALGAFSEELPKSAAGVVPAVGSHRNVGNVPRCSEGDEGHFAAGPAYPVAAPGETVDNDTPALPGNRGGSGAGARPSLRAVLPGLCHYRNSQVYLQ
jgi:hypothetical protein